MTTGGSSQMMQPERIKMQLKEEWEKWRDMWINMSEDSPPPANATTTTANKTETRQSDALESARRFAFEKSEGKYLKLFLRRLFAEAKELGANAPLTTARSPESKACQVRKIEWHLVLVLELWMRHGDGPFLEVCYPFLVKQTKKQKKLTKKKQTLPQISVPEKRVAVLQHLWNILGKAAFFLPPGVSLREFLPQRCLTAHHWKQIPLVVTYLLNEFEMTNPHLSKEEEEDCVLSTIRRLSTKKKKPKMFKKAKSSQRPRLLIQKKSRFGGSHFHRSNSLKEMSKLLDTTTPKKKSKLVTPHTVAKERFGKAIKMKPNTARASSSNGAIKSKNYNRNALLKLKPSTGSRSKQVPTTANAQRPLAVNTMNNKRDIAQPETPPKKRPRTTSFSSDIPATPMMTPIAKNYRGRSSTTFSLPETPITATPKRNNTSNTKLVVNETPLLSRSRGVVNETSLPSFPKNIVTETPLQSRSKVGETPVSTVVGETPCNKPRQGVAETPLPPSPAASVVPMKLFATLKPRPPSKAKPKSPKSPKSRLRPTSKVLTAARAYLRRNSSLES
jgi:hypothetical protein